MAEQQPPAVGTPAEAAKPPPPAAKPAKRPPSPWIPRALAGAAILTLLAIPVVIPVAIMKATGKTGARSVNLADAIEAPPDVVAAADEESSPAEARESFLTISNTTFERYCRPYYTAGFNAYELVEAAMVSRRAETTGDRSGAQIVDDTIRDAASRGINTIRMWGHTTSSIYPFQTSPGIYDERGLRALDYVLETARKYGVQVRSWRGVSLVVAIVRPGFSTRHAPLLLLPPPSLSLTTSKKSPHPHPHPHKTPPQHPLTTTGHRLPDRQLEVLQRR